MTNNSDGRKPVHIKGLKLARQRVQGDIPLSRLCEFYLVLRALDGDKLAQEILDSAGVIVHDLDGNQIYPPRENRD